MLFLFPALLSLILKSASGVLYPNNFLSSGLEDKTSKFTPSTAALSAPSASPIPTSNAAPAAAPKAPAAPGVLLIADMTVGPAGTEAGGLIEEAYFIVPVATPFSIS